MLPAWVGTLLTCCVAAGCTSFLGYERDGGDAESRDGSLDAGNSSSDANVEGAFRDATELGGDEGPLTCGLSGYACDPVANSGCETGFACEFSTAPLTMPRCVPVGTASFGEPCDFLSRQYCSAGLSCLHHRCLRACCATGGDDQCGIRGGLPSRCAIFTDLTGLGGCTVPGTCDYVLQRGCSSGVFCYATDVWGSSMCLSPGGAALYSPCISYSDCMYGNTCAGTPGTCRQVCNPLGVNTCPLGSACLTFSDRPSDYGFCR